MIETEEDMFTLQGRMVVANGPNGDDANATVFSAIVARAKYSDTVQFELSQSGITARINGEIVDISESANQPFNNVTLSDEGNNSYSAVFSLGVYLEVRRENDIISTVLISVPTSFQGKTRGLMGSFNGDTTDDLAPRSGNGIGQPIPSNASLQDIHELFGITCELIVRTILCFVTVFYYTRDYK